MHCNRRKWSGETNVQKCTNTSHRASNGLIERYRHAFMPDMFNGTICTMIPDFAVSSFVRLRDTTARRFAWLQYIDLCQCSLYSLFRTEPCTVLPKAGLPDMALRPRSYLRPSLVPQSTMIIGRRSCRTCVIRLQPGVTRLCDSYHRRRHSCLLPVADYKYQQLV